MVSDDDGCRSSRASEIYILRGCIGDDVIHYRMGHQGRHQPVIHRPMWARPRDLSGFSVETSLDRYLGC